MKNIFSSLEYKLPCIHFNTVQHSQLLQLMEIKAISIQNKTAPLLLFQFDVILFCRPLHLLYFCPSGLRRDLTDCNLLISG